MRAAPRSSSAARPCGLARPATSWNDFGSRQGSDTPPVHGDRSRGAPGAPAAGSAHLQDRPHPARGAAPTPSVRRPTVLERRRRRRWLPELAHQFTHPLALLLWAAAGLAWIAGILAVAVAIVIVIVDQRRLRLHPGDAGRARRRGARPLPARAGAGAARRRPARGDSERARARRRGPAGRGRAHLGRCPPAGGRRRGGHLDLDRRVDAGVSLGELHGHRGAPAAGPRPRLQRHDLHRGRGSARSSSRPGCAPSWAGSRRSPSASSARRARSSARSGASPG